MYMWEVVKEIFKNNPKNKNPKQVAIELEVSESQAYRWQEDPEGTGCDILAKKIIPFTKSTGSDKLLKHFANECGYQIVKLPEPKKHKSIKHLLKDLTKTIKEFSDFTQETAKSLDDNKISDLEIDNINKECDEALEEILHLKLEVNNG